MICNAPVQNMHHVFFGTANRKKSTIYKMVAPLCLECHNKIHRQHKYDLELKQKAQAIWEKTYGSREDFIRTFGKNYL